MKLPPLTRREIFLLVVIAALGCEWWRQHLALALLSERNQTLETWVQAAKDAGWIFADGRGDKGETNIVLPPR